MQDVTDHLPSIALEPDYPLRLFRYDVRDALQGLRRNENLEEFVQTVFEDDEEQKRERLRDVGVFAEQFLAATKMWKELEAEGMKAKPEQSFNEQSFNELQQSFNEKKNVVQDERDLAEARLYVHLVNLDANLFLLAGLLLGIFKKKNKRSAFFSVRIMDARDRIEMATL